MSDDSTRPEGSAPAGERNYNEAMIAEFRDRRGRLGGSFDGAPVLLLHHLGARSGAERINPMMYQQVGDSYAVFASAAGRDRNPAWYHNLRSHPDTTIEIGDGEAIGTVRVHAREAAPAERDPIWEAQKERYPGFAEYEKQTDRVIPVILLDPVQGRPDSPSN